MAGVKPLDIFKIMNPMSRLINQSLNMHILKIKCVNTSVQNKFMMHIKTRHMA